MKTFNRKRPVLIDKHAQDRRRFLKLGGGALVAHLTKPAIATTLAPTTLTTPAERAAPARRLRLYNVHTGEQFNSLYWEDGAYQREGLDEIDRLLRDYRSGEIRRIDNGLLDLLYMLSASLDTQEGFHVISGYRSPATNAMLREKGHGVAKRSLHMEGLAIDIRVPGRDLADVRRAAIALNGGGVGYYPASDFVHVDVGRLRTW